jgi:hypothetical protein
MDDNANSDATCRRSVKAIPVGLNVNPRHIRAALHNKALHSSAAHLGPQERRRWTLKLVALCIRHQAERPHSDRVWRSRSRLMQLVECVSLGKLRDDRDNSMLLWPKRNALLRGDAGLLNAGTQSGCVGKNAPRLGAANLGRIGRTSQHA